MRKNIPLVCLLVLSIIQNASAIAVPKKNRDTLQKKDAPKPKPKRANPKEEAQKLKSEVKEWEKRKKDLEPLQLKALLEENHRLRMQNQKLDVNIRELVVKLEETSNKEVLHAREHEHEKSSMPAIMAIKDLAELPAGSYTVNQATGQVFIGGVLDERYGVETTTGTPFIKGIIFKVQIGAKEDLDLKDVLIDEVHHENLEQEKEQDVYKYTIGHFRNYWEANKLKKGLRKMGIELAWIVPYQNGKRVVLKEVLTTVLEQKAKLNQIPQPTLKTTSAAIAKH